MTNIDIIANLRSISAQLVTYRGTPLTCEESEAVEEAIEAVEKQTSKTPILKEPSPNNKWYLCPVCNTFVRTELDKFCTECGQALCWSEVEE